MSFNAPSEVQAISAACATESMVEHRHGRALELGSSGFSSGSIASVCLGSEVRGHPCLEQEAVGAFQPGAFGELEDG